MTTYKKWRDVDDWDFQILEVKIEPQRKKPEDSIWAVSTHKNVETRSFAGKRSKIYTVPVMFVSAGFKPTADEEKQQQRRGLSSPPPPHSTEAGSIQSNEDLGGWEQHTKGIGLKIMLKMGYQVDKGLGRNHQGILKPIEAKLQMGKGAMGYHGNESLQAFPLINPKKKKEKVVLPAGSRSKIQKDLGQRCEDPAGPGGKRQPKSSQWTNDELRLAATSTGELAHLLQSAIRQREKGQSLLASLKNESQALLSRLDTKADAIQRMEAVMALVKHLPAA